MSEEHLTPKALEELHRLARSRPRSGRAHLAKLGALRTLERLERERRERERGKPQPARRAWEVGENPPAFELYVWSEVERLMFGALAYPLTSPRAAHETAQIQAVVDRLLAAEDSHKAFREFVEVSARDGPD